MIRDRGLAKKWTGMLMPEHIHLLCEWEKTSKKQYPKEKMDWEWEDLQQDLLTIYHKKQTVELTLWRNKWVMVRGRITLLDHPHQRILLETDTTIKKIDFREIDNVMVLEG
ncbi:YolD-like family protein [Lysinibacillus fusiformis]|uniref:YolD-like family protein n=1 Tax=Lysinibacillus fusiformis TaxID=28031 RepID=UPI0011A74D85|nr:YolD-like family protein [Lysinibacillus fusiformis]